MFDQAVKRIVMISIPDYRAGKEKSVRESPLEFALEVGLIIIDGKVCDAIDDSTQLATIQQQSLIVKSAGHAGFFPQF